MNLDRHLDSLSRLLRGPGRGRASPRPRPRATSTQEYFAVADLPASSTSRRCGPSSRSMRSRRAARRGAAARRSGRNPAHGAADRRGRARRHLLARADARRTRFVQEPAPVHAHALYSGRRRPLRRVQRPALEPQIYPIVRDVIHHQRLASTARPGRTVASTGHKRSRLIAVPCACARRGCALPAAVPSARGHEAGQTIPRSICRASSGSPTEPRNSAKRIGSPRTNSFA